MHRTGFSENHLILSNQFIYQTRGELLVARGDKDYQCVGGRRESVPIVFHKYAAVLPTLSHSLTHFQKVLGMQGTQSIGATAQAELTQQNPCTHKIFCFVRRGNFSPSFYFLLTSLSLSLYFFLSLFLFGLYIKTFFFFPVRVLLVLWPYACARFFFTCTPTSRPGDNGECMCVCVCV